MSIAFGADGLEHQVKHLKAQVAAKDAELNSLRNELHKKADLFAAEKQAKDDALYQGRIEAERADAAEKNLSSKNADISTLRQQLYNLESSLKNSDEKLKKAEKENQRIQYDLDCSSANSGEERTRRLQDEKVALQGKVKDLEGTLRKKETEIDELRRDGGGSGWGAQGTSRSDKARMSALESEVSSLQEENAKLRTAVPLPSSPPRMKKSHTTANFFGDSFSPAPALYKGRRRSTSLTDPRIAELEAEVQSLRSSSGSADVDALRVKLSATITARDKLENQKLAFEKSAKREISELREQLESMRDEVEFYRSNDGSGGNKSKDEIEKIKKDLNARIADLEERLRRKTEEVEALQRDISRIPDLEAELDELKPLKASSLKPSADDGSKAKIDNLQQQISSLQSELESARNAPPTAASSGPTAVNKQMRQLQRDLDTIKRERDALKAAVEENDDLIAQKDEELFALKSAIPMPGSPNLSTRSVGDDTASQTLRDRIASLEADRVDLLKAKKECMAALDEQVERVAELNVEIGELKAQLAGSTGCLSSVREELVAAQQAQAQMTSALADKEQLLSFEREKYDTLSNQLSQSATALEDLQNANLAISEKDCQLQNAHADLETARAAVQALQTQRDEMFEAQTASADKLQVLEQDLASMRQAKTDGETLVTNLQTQLENAVQGHREEEATSAALRIELEGFSSLLRDKTAAFENLEEQYREAGAQIAQLEQQRLDLQEIISNRSTESEARVRDEELFEWKERAATLKKQLSAARSEHKREVEESQFLRRQDNEEAQRHSSSLRSQVGDLQSKIDGLSSRIASKERRLQEHELRIAQLTALPSDELDEKVDDKRHVQLLHTKIEQLRTQRDELRQRLSYLTHESRFALSASEVDKISALEDLQKVRMELKVNTTAHQKLQAELSTSQARLSEVSGRLASAEASYATASSDKHDLADKIAQLELDLGRVQKDRADMESSAQELVSDLARSNGILQKTKKDLATAQANEKVLERRIDQIQAEQKKLVDEPAVEDDGTDAPRTRTISGASTSDKQRFTNELEYLRSKIVRRDEAIEGLGRALARSKANESLGKETNEEHEEEIAELKGEVSKLQTEVASKVSALFELQRSSQTITDDLAARTAALDALQKEHEGTKSNLAATSAQVVSLDATRLELQNEVASLKTRESEARQSLSEQQAEVKSLSSRIVDLQMVQDELQGKLEESTKREAAVAGQLESARTFNQQLSNEIGELRKQQASAVDSAEHEETIKRLQGELETLVADLAAADEAHAHALREANAHAEAAKNASTMEIARLMKQSAALESTISEKTAELVRSVPEMERLRDELANEQMISKKVQGQAEERETRIAELQLQKAQAEESLKEAKSSNAALQAKIALLQESSSVTRNSHETLVNDLLASKKATQVLQARVDNLSADLEAAMEIRTHHEGMMQSLKEDLERSDKTAKQNASLLKYQEGEVKSQTKAVKMLQEQLATAQKTSALASDKLKDAELEVERLTGEYERVKRELANAGTGASGGAEVEELKETISNLEASLNLKNQELDDADDRIREAYTAKLKAEKKVAKLTRQLAARETESQTAINTAMNAKLTAAPPSAPPTIIARTVVPATTPKTSVNVFAAPTPRMEMAPPPAPTPKSASVPASPASRQALRPVNIFDRSQVASTDGSQIGAKRLREDAADEKLPADAIMLPPVKLQPSPRRPAKAFAPQWGSVFAPKSPKASYRPPASPRTASENIFSRTPTMSRNTFSTSQLPSQSPYSH